jgi:alpha-L-rhamnosidase
MPLQIHPYATLAFLSALAGSLSGSPLRVEDPRCEYRLDPVGIDVAQPRLSWTLRGDQRGQRQTAYQILVAGSPDTLARDDGNLWTTGQVASDQTIHVTYGGQPLGSRQTC